MNRSFFDTSALVKIYHRETGSDFCLGCYKGQAAIIISELACLEFHSTIYRKYRDKELCEKALMAVLEKFESDRVQRYEVVHVASFIYDEACKLLSEYARIYGLRTLDSLQLATFLTYCEKDNDSFVCADRKLSLLVERMGCFTVYV